MFPEVSTLVVVMSRNCPTNPISDDEQCLTRSNIVITCLVALGFLARWAEGGLTATPGTGSHNLDVMNSELDPKYNLTTDDISRSEALTQKLKSDRDMEQSADDDIK